MHPVIEDNRTAILGLCSKYHVAQLDVFGSATQETFDHSRSDVDFVVEFRHSESMDAVDQYFGLLEDLEALFGRRVDLVCAGAMRNPYFIRSVNASRRPIYAA